MRWLLPLLVLCACGPPVPPVESGARPSADEEPAAGAAQDAVAGAHLPSALRRPRLRIDGVTIGHPDAPLQLELYTDFQCPACGPTHRALEALARRYPAKLLLRHRDFPMDPGCNPSVSYPFHNRACSAAFHARCAARQNHFWDYARLVFRARETLRPTDLLEHARQLELDLEAFTVCITLPETHLALLRDMEQAKRDGVRGTPTVIVRLRGAVLQRVVGHRSTAWWQRRVGQLLDRAQRPASDRRGGQAPALRPTGRAPASRPTRRAPASQPTGRPSASQPLSRPRPSPAAVDSRRAPAAAPSP